jgi:nitrate/nitrite transporter NarK
VATHIEARATTGAREAGTQEVRPYPGYRALWVWLLLGWVASGADRTITGPVVTYMIQAKVPIISAAEHPFALGGLVGSLLFAGYMVTQFSGGHIGDRFGHSTVIVIAVLWAGVATVLSGVVTALLGAVFGMMNLIGEMGAVLSPAISGVLRNATGQWTTAVFLDGGLMLVSFVLLCFVRERRTAPAPGRFVRDAG